MFTPRCTQLHCAVSLWVAQEKIPVLCDAQNNIGIAHLHMTCRCVSFNSEFSGPFFARSAQSRQQSLSAKTRLFQINS